MDQFIRKYLKMKIPNRQRMNPAAVATARHRRLSAMVAPLFVGEPKSVNALTEAMNRDKHVFLATQKKAGIDNPKEDDINSIGTIGNSAATAAAAGRNR